MERVADQSWSSSYTYQVSKHSAEMLSNLNNQRKNGGRFCDVILRVGDESFPAHKAVLAACSEYFESVFSCQAEDGGDSGGGAGGGGGSGGNETKELEMHTISSKVFKDILDFAYTSKIVVRLECFPELMTAAKFLLMRSVIEICQEVIKQSNVQILVPPARPDLALFRAGAPDLGYPLDMSNGSGLLANGTVFPGAHDGEVNPRGASPQALAPLPGPAPQLSPQLLAGPFPGGGASGGGLAGKRGRGRPKKIANSDPLLFGGPAIPKDVGFFPCGLCGKVFTDTSRLRNHEAQHGAAAAAAAASGATRPWWRGKSAAATTTTAAAAAAFGTGATHWTRSGYRTGRQRPGFAGPPRHRAQTREDEAARRLRHLR
ncbi:PATZ1 protein, partial [Polypterus senegalus]